MGGTRSASCCAPSHPIPRCLPCSKGWKLPRLSLGAKSSPGEGVTHSPLNQRQRCYQPVEPAAPPQRSPGWEPDGSSTAPCLPRCLGPTFASRGRWKSPLCPREPQFFLGVVLSCPPMCPLQGWWPCPCVPSVCPPCPRSMPFSVLCLHSSLPWGHWPLGGEQDLLSRTRVSTRNRGSEPRGSAQHFFGSAALFWFTPGVRLCSFHSPVPPLPGCRDAPVLKTQPRGCKEQKKNVGTAPKICCPGMRAAQGTDPMGRGFGKGLGTGSRCGAHGRVSTRSSPKPCAPSLAESHLHQALRGGGGGFRRLALQNAEVEPAQHAHPRCHVTAEPTAWCQYICLCHHFLSFSI